MAERIGDMLIRKGLITQEQLTKALGEQSKTGKFLGEILVKMQFITEEGLLKALAEQFNTHFVALSNVKINPAISRMVPGEMAWEYKVMPIEMRNMVLLIAVPNPLDMWPMSSLQEKLKLSEVQFVLATKSDILKTIEKYYGPEIGTR
jgi:type IV pilus assembly protein PilB